MQHKIANVPTHILNFFALPPPNHPPQNQGYVRN